MNKTIISIIITSSLASALLANQSSPTHQVRVYCFYIPKDKVQKQTAISQLKSLTYLKLMDKDQPKESKKVGATFDAQKRLFQVDKELYQKLGKECEAFIGDKGKVIGLKATDYGYPEKLTYFYLLEPKDQETGLVLQSNELINESNLEDLPKLKLTPGNLEVLKNVFDKKPKALKEIKEELEKKTELPKIAREESATANLNYAQSALSVAAFLASLWFAPTVVGLGTELLYPYVYHALFGIPSPFNPSYLLVYLPGKANAVTWATKNSTAIIKAIGTLFAVGKAGYDWYKGSPEELEKFIEELKNQLVAK